ncbi:sugar phosphate isomerase/epimerase [Streptomyces sp. NPDC050625]|uniref:sugar phosphate isomerase/epimerase family protein n=1 Tax=Streptomyces sp. NPDC050625 TaxID=3154629 RepID=UPI0034205A37
MTAEDLSARLGIFARTFRRTSPEQVADAVRAAGYALGHWNFAALGLPTLAGGVPRSAFLSVRQAFDAAKIGIPSVSCTYNVIHPDTTQRNKQTDEARRLISHVGLLGADVVTLCTGTRDPDDMWRGHPANGASDAWKDLRATLDELLPATAEAGVVLGVEPEPGNVVRDAQHAARLLAELGDSAPIGIVFDPANLLTPSTVHQQEQILKEAVDLLGPRIIGAQAKDVVDGGYSAAGAGSMDYDLVFRLLAQIDPVPVIVQDATEGDARRVRDDLVHRHAAAGVGP